MRRRAARRGRSRSSSFNKSCGGHHEASRDEFKAEHNAWNYAIRGRTIDDRDLRVIVSFDEEDHLLLVTAIDLDEGSKEGPP